MAVAATKQRFFTFYNENIMKISYARVKYRVYIKSFVIVLVIAGEAGYNGILAGVHKKCAQYKC